MKPLDILVWAVFLVVLIALVLAAAVIGSSWHEERAKEEALHLLFLKLDSELFAAAKLVMPENMVPPFPESLRSVLEEILALDDYRSRFEEYLPKCRTETVLLLKLTAEERRGLEMQFSALTPTGKYVEGMNGSIVNYSFFFQSTIMKECIGDFFEKEIAAAKEWQKIDTDVNIKLAEAERNSPQIF
jgi:hypothetical protein